MGTQMEQQEQKQTISEKNVNDDDPVYMFITLFDCFRYRHWGALSVQLPTIIRIIPHNFAQVFCLFGLLI